MSKAEELGFRKDLALADVLSERIGELLNRIRKNPQKQVGEELDFLYKKKKLNLEYNSWMWGWPGIRIMLNDYGAKYPIFDPPIDSMTLLEFQIAQLSISFDNEGDDVVMKPRAAVRPEWQGMGIATAIGITFVQLADLSLLQFPDFVKNNGFVIEIEDHAHSVHSKQHPRGFSSFLAKQLGYNNLAPNGKSNIWTKRIK